ncbi:hypothetical protein AQJ11_28910 [Streptomyces corchorusii]|uniref:Uncharacterized protein n=1 Tax=Streptomyces corchorusii TaxID=1903 RepID=A0A101PYY3_STRCK|nr:hypothetical protein AQJ11_28910 [Streptomyces corchorusii]
MPLARCGQGPPGAFRCRQDGLRVQRRSRARVLHRSLLRGGGGGLLEVGDQYASRWSRTRWKARCHSTGQLGHHDGSMSSNCSRRSSDSAPADDCTGRPSARRCSISAAFRAVARAFFSQMPTL